MPQQFRPSYLTVYVLEALIRDLYYKYNIDVSMSPTRLIWSPFSYLDINGCPSLNYFVKIIKLLIKAPPYSLLLQQIIGCFLIVFQIGILNISFQELGITPVDQIKSGQRLEVQHELAPSSVWIVRTLENVGGRLLLRYEGTDRATNDFWLFYLNHRLHPIGWAKENDCIYKPPEGKHNHLDVGILIVVNCRILTKIK